MDMINLKNNMLMNKKKCLYEAPTTNILVVRFEGAILTGSDGVNQSNHTHYLNGGGLDDDYELL